MQGLSIDIQKQFKYFSLDLKLGVPGKITGILGASGSGKSVCLKSAAGIMMPDKGRITAGNTVFFDKSRKINLSPQKRRVGYLFQNYALFPNMTVEGNIAAGIRKGTKNQKQIVRELVSQLKLEGLEKQYPVQLSGGQQQRTALARILASRPDILLLDEPFSALDSYLKEELQLELKSRLEQFEGQVLLVSHDRDEIYRLCTHTMILSRGRNLICKETKELFLNPEKMEAARLTGCKNISKAAVLDEHLVEAVEWGVRFRVSKKIPGGLRYVGIRAHDFIPVESSGITGVNEIVIDSPEFSDAPFERNILFKNRDNPSGTMWMKLKDKSKQIPVRVRVDEDKILLMG